jgi:hypothetical protein
MQCDMICSAHNSLLQANYRQAAQLSTCVCVCLKTSQANHFNRRRGWRNLFSRINRANINCVFIHALRLSDCPVGSGSVYSGYLGNVLFINNTFLSKLTPITHYILIFYYFYTVSGAVKIWG